MHLRLVAASHMQRCAAQAPRFRAAHATPRIARAQFQDDGAAEAAAQPADAELLSGDAIEGDELATKTGQLDVMLEFLWQVHGVDFYSGGGGELSVGLYRSVKERLMRTPPDVEFRAVRIQKPQSGNLVDDKRRARPSLSLFLLLHRLHATACTCTQGCTGLCGVMRGSQGAEGACVRVQGSR